MGQIMTYFVISAPANLAALDKYQQTAPHRALAAGLSKAVA
jgi:hypothetical protein